MLAKERPEWNIGISTWGANDPRFWLIKSKPLEVLLKLFAKRPNKPKDILLEPNCSELFFPAYTWTRKIKNGNIEGIIEANRKNLQRFTEVFGKPDIIHAHISHPGGFVAMKLSEELGIPYVLTEQMSPFPLPSYKGDYEKWLLPPLQNAAAVLSVGENLSEELQQFGIATTPMVNFIDMDRFSPNSNDPQPVPRLFALGRLEGQKGVDLLLEAMAALSDQKWKLRIGGDGSDKSFLKGQIRKLKLEGRVELIGGLSQDQVAVEMKSCDFFVLPSRHESFGIVAIEAMSCGKPLVYTRCGGVTDQLDERVGEACEVNFQSLQKGIKRMLENFSAYKPEDIRKFVEDRYSPGVAVDHLETIYRAALV